MFAPNSQDADPPGETPPPILLQEDDEVQYCIVEPILNDIVRNVQDHCRINALQGIVDMTLQDIDRETKARQVTDAIESIVNMCIDDAVAQAGDQGMSFSLKLYS